LIVERNFYAPKALVPGSIPVPGVALGVPPSALERPRVVDDHGVVEWAAKTPHSTP
jgi:hypothetical protein